MDRLAAARRAQAAAFYDDTATWRDARGYDLSDRVWRNRGAVRSQIDDILRQGIANGTPVGQVADALIRFVRPSYAGTPGGGTARYAATRLAGNETRRAHALATRDVARTNPAGGWLRYQTAAGHIDPDECTDLAQRESTVGRGVYPADDCPLPPRHVGCKCFVESISDHRDMAQFVEQLRAEYELEDPTDLSPEDLAIFRQQTAEIRQAVQFQFQSWFEQTGLVSREQLLESSPSVREWVNGVRAGKAQRRAARMPGRAQQSRTPGIRTTSAPAFKNADEAVSWAKVNLKSVIDTETFAKIDPRTLQDVLGAVADFERVTGRRVPAVIEFSGKKVGRGAWAHYDHNTRTLRMKPSVTREAMERTRVTNAKYIEDYGAPFAVYNDPYELMVHEMGHAVDAATGWSFTGRLRSEAAWDMSKISAYAGTKNEEAWAESFLAIAIDSPQAAHVPAPLADAARKLLGMEP